MFLHKILDLQAALLFIKYKILLENPTEMGGHVFLHYYYELGIQLIQVFDIQAEKDVYCYKIFVYELWVRVVGHKMIWSRDASIPYRRRQHFKVDSVLPISIVLHLKLTPTMILKELYSIEKCAICLDTFLRF